MNIRFNKIDGFIRIPNGSRYLVLFGLENYASSTRIGNLKKKRYTRYYAKINIDSYDFLPIEKLLTLHNVVILIKPVLNKNWNLYYCNILLEKCSYQLAKK